MIETLWEWNLWFLKWEAFPAAAYLFVSFLVWGNAWIGGPVTGYQPLGPVNENNPPQGGSGFVGYALMLENMRGEIIDGRPAKPEPPLNVREGGWGWHVVEKRFVKPTKV